MEAERTPEKVRDLLFTVFASPRDGPLRVVCVEAREAVEAGEVRERQRRADDYAGFALAVDALVCGALRAALLARTGTGTGKLAVPRGRKARQAELRRGRYGEPHPADLGKAADALVAVGVLVAGEAGRRARWIVAESEPGRWHRVSPARRSTVAASPALLARADALGVDLGAVGERPGREVVILRERPGWDGRPPAEVPYGDTPETHALRTAVQGINRALDAAHASGAVQWIGGPGVNLTRLSLRRIFNGDPTAPGAWVGGRFYGGWWDNLPKLDRLRSIRIEGEAVAELDVGQALPRLAYARAGAEVPTGGDLYALGGFGPGDREGVKALLNAALFSPRLARKEPAVPSLDDPATWPLTGWPRIGEDGGEGGTLSAEFPSGLGFEDAMARLLTGHAAIAGLLGRDLGMALMRAESDALAAVLGECAAAGIVALPVHDAVIVKASRADEAAGIVRRAWREVTGFEPPVRLTVNGQGNRHAA